MKKKKKEKVNDRGILYNIVSGIIIGIGFIIPGVSGGVLAVLLGVYDSVIFSINSFKNNILKNSKFLISLGIGVVIGAIGFSNVLVYLLKTREFAIKYIFIGLIIGGLPSLLKNIKIKSKKSINPLFLILALALSAGMVYLEANLNISNLVENNSVIAFSIAGLFYSMGKIIPGVSGAALLMLIGVYEPLLKLLSNPLLITKAEIIMLIPFGISFLISAVILFKLINYLLKKHYNKTYSAVLGFVIGSILFIYPGFNFDLSGIICILLLVFSSIVTYYFSKSN